MRKPKNGGPEVLCLLLNPDNGGLYAIFLRCEIVVHCLLLGNQMSGMRRNELDDCGLMVRISPEAEGRAATRALAGCGNAAIGNSFVRLIT